MIPVPDSVARRFVATLKDHGIYSITDYLKWLHYFFDFSAKHASSSTAPEQVRLFLAKLLEKGQSETHREQASHAVSLYLEMMELTCTAKPNRLRPELPDRLPRFSEAGYNSMRSSSSFATD